MPKPRRKEQKGQTRSSIQEQARSSILSPDSVPLVNILSQLKQVVVGDDDEENERNFKQKINEIPQSESQQISDSMHDDISREGSLQESARNSSIENSQESARNSSIENSQEINQSQYTSQEMMHEQQYPEYESDDQEEGDGEYEEEEEESQYTNSAYTNSAELANLVDEYGSFASLQSSNALKVSTNLSCANCKTLQDQLAMTRLKFEGLMTMQHEWEAGKMHRKLALLQEEVDGKEEELDKMRLDMEILGQKLIDEIEKRAEIQHANESVNHELEELTQSLFEEANTLVANEARERHGAIEKQQLLAKQLQEITVHLQLEQAQSRELRVRISQLEQDIEDAQIAKAKDQSDANRPSKLVINGSHNSLASTSLTSPHELIDQNLLAHFGELVKKGPKLKMTKIHDLIFMRNTLDDDVTPCLRFGGNPRTSTRKFIDAIIANTCFIEEMKPEQIKELQDRDEANEAIRKQSSPPSPEKKSADVTTPTMLLFNKTMLERISNALSTSSESLLPEKGGCSTCGREEPYKYRFKISDVQQDVWYPICLDCRIRLLSVVDFYQFIRNMRQGLFSTRSVNDLFLEVLELKRRMFYARMGCGSIKNPDSVLTKLDPIRPNSSLIEMVESAESPLGKLSIIKD